MGSLSEEKQKIQNNKKPTGSNLYCCIMGMVLCWTGVIKIWQWYWWWLLLWRKPSGCLLEQRIRHGLQWVDFLGLWLVGTSKWGLCTEGGIKDTGDQVLYDLRCFSCLLSLSFFLLSLTNIFWRASSIKEVQEPVGFPITKTLFQCYLPPFISLE